MGRVWLMVKMYDELASWWPLLSPAADYEEEAAFYGRVLEQASARPIRTMLELGSGGGHNASHLKRRFDMVLVEPSAGMRAVSRTLNPDCEHIEGDMRTVRLGRQFDAVFVHDAVCYMTTEPDLQRAIETAFLHCHAGGVALFAPDYTSENFRPGTDCGGSDEGPRGLRYLEWVWDPDSSDTTYVVDYAYLLRTADGVVSVEHDRHFEGVFARADWLKLLFGAGFEDARIVPLEHSDVEPGSHEVFVARKPGARAAATTAKS
jgi:SAM-dependent methyltransferase